MARCKYIYKEGQLKGKQCPHEALPGSDFCKWHEKKDGKDFSGQEIKETDLAEAYLVEANLHGTKFKERTILKFANLKGAGLSGAYLERANLHGADLQGTNLEFSHLRKTDLRGSNLEEAFLRGADLFGIHLENSCHLKGACFEHSILEKAHLENADLRVSDLKYTHLEGAYFEKALLEGAHLYNANLQGAHLKDAYLRGANLEYARLREADLTHADLGAAELNKADLRAAFLYQVKITGAESLQYANIGTTYIEEIIANKLSSILRNRKNYKNDIEKALRRDFKKLGLPEEDIEVFITEAEINLNEILITLKMIYEYRKGISKSGVLNYKKYLYNHSLDVYVKLKNYFRDVGFYDKSAIYFIGEFRIRGKISEIFGNMNACALLERIKNFFPKLIFWRKNKHNERTDEIPEGYKEKNFFILLQDMLKNYFAFLINRLFSLTSSYGESIGRILLTVFLIIFTYGSIYSMTGAVISSNIVYPTHNFLTGLYFSIVTFTTLGYGDLHPINNTALRLTAGSEAFLGAFTIAYFVVVVSRKIMR